NVSGLPDPLGGSYHTNFADVTELFQAAAGNLALASDLIPVPNQFTNRTPVHSGPDPLVSIPTVVARGPGPICVPINIDSARPAGSAGLTEAVLVVKFDSAAVHVAAVSTGSATAGFGLDTSLDAGLLVIHLRSETPVASSGGGSLAIITFQANPG